MTRWQDVVIAIINWFDPPNRMDMDQIVAYRKELEARPPFEVVRASTPPPAPVPPVQGPRSHAVMHQAYPNNGDLLKHRNDVERQRFVTRKLEPTDTSELQRVPHKFNLLIHSEPPPGDALHETPAFLKDKKVS